MLNAVAIVGLLTLPATAPPPDDPAAEFAAWGEANGIVIDTTTAACSAAMCYAMSAAEGLTVIAWEPGAETALRFVVIGGTEGQVVDGQWFVPEEIEPGVYTTTVPTDSRGCYWELSSVSGEIVDNDNVDAGTRAIVEIAPRQDEFDPSVQAEVFTSNGCGVWVRAEGR